MVRIFTLCDKCNKEFELDIDDYGFVVFQDCPFCESRNDRWLRIVEK